MGSTEVVHIRGPQGWSIHWVHRGGPYTGSTRVVHILGPQGWSIYWVHRGGPYTGGHVLYMSNSKSPDPNL